LGQTDSVRAKTLISNQYSRVDSVKYCKKAKYNIQKPFTKLNVTTVLRYTQRLQSEYYAQKITL